MGDQQNAGKQTPPKPTLEDVSSELVGQAQDSARAALWQRIENGDVTSTIDLVDDPSWPALKRDDPDLAIRIEENAPALKAEREEHERLEQERLAQLDEAGSLNELSDEERGQRLSDELEADVDRQVEDIVQRSKHLPGELGSPEHRQAYDAIEAEIADARALADVMSFHVSGTGPDVIGIANPAVKVDAWNAADRRTQALAESLFGIRPPFDLDVDSDAYREDLDAAGKENAETAAWVREQHERADRTRRNRR